jgi:dTMP kinase
MSSLQHHYPGIFISFEGIDGAGKSTHIPYFSQLIQERFPLKKVLLTREPGGTVLGEKLRQLLLNDQMDTKTEALLMFASRQEHIAQIIEPALKRGDIVISDRFTDSSFAYQCGGRGLKIDELNTLEQWVQSRGDLTHSYLLQPQLTLLFDLSAKVAEERRSSTRNPDKFEELDLDFFNHVRNEYLRRASQDSQRFLIIDSSQPITKIQDLLKDCVNQL